MKIPSNFLSYSFIHTHTPTRELTHDPHLCVCLFGNGQVLATSPTVLISKIVLEIYEKLLRWELRVNCKNHVTRRPEGTETLQLEVDYCDKRSICVFLFSFFGNFTKKRRRKNAKLRSKNSRLILSILVDATEQIMASLAHLRWRSSLLCSMYFTCTTCTSRELLNVPPQLFSRCFFPSLFYLLLSLTLSLYFEPCSPLRRCSFF